MGRRFRRGTATSLSSSLSCRSYGFNSKTTLVSLLALTRTCCVCFPRVSCHTCKVYVTALVPESHLGVVAERNEGAWEVGPTLEFPIPLFDQGQAHTGRSMAELRRTQQAYYALGVRIRSTVRTVRDRLQGAQDRALYYRDIILPLRARIVNEVQLQYNAMQLGVFEILRAREQQIQAAVAYIETLLDYWLARTDLGQLLSGRLPSPGGSAMARMGRPTTTAESAGH